MYFFIIQEENTELREKMEDLEDKITIEQDRKKDAEESLKARNKLLVGIREGLDHLVQTLVSPFSLDQSTISITSIARDPGNVDTLKFN